MSVVRVRLFVCRYIFQRSLESQLIMSTPHSTSTLSMRYFSLQYKSTVVFLMLLSAANISPVERAMVRALAALAKTELQ